MTSRKKAAAAKAHLAAIVDSADAAIIAKDLDGRIHSCNAAAERLFGHTTGELVGREVRILIPAERQSEEDDILPHAHRCLDDAIASAITMYRRKSAIALGQIHGS